VTCRSSVTKNRSVAGRRGISLIVVETDENLRGFERGRVLEKIGKQDRTPARCLWTCGLRCEPARRARGGWASSSEEQLSRERLIIAPCAPAWPNFAVLEAIRYTKQRDAFGSPRSKFQPNRLSLAELQAETLSIQTTTATAASSRTSTEPRPALRRGPKTDRRLGQEGGRRQTGAASLRRLRYMME